VTTSATTSSTAAAAAASTQQVDWNTMYFNCAVSPSESNTRRDEDVSGDDTDDETRSSDRTCRLSKYEHTTEHATTGSYSHHHHRHHHHHHHHGRH